MARNSADKLGIFDIAAEDAVERCTDLRAHLRAASAERHDEIDRLYGSLDLAQRDGYARFLAASALGWSALWPQWQRFTQVKLHRPTTPYLAMLHDDLADLGIAAGALPVMSGSRARSSLGAGYVLAGSRMGMGVVRKRPHWGAANRTARRFFADDSGPGLFRATIACLEQSLVAGRHLHCIESSMLAAFDIFAEAFDRSAEVVA